MYSLNGGNHKMAELVPQSPVVMGMSGQPGVELGIYGDTSMPDYSMDDTSYIDVEPLNFNDSNRMYEELKRPSSSHMQPFFGNLDNMHSASNIFEQNSSGFSSLPDLFKNNSDGMSGYIDMLGSSESLLTIKQEKPDYHENRTMGIGNHSQETNFVANTCVEDWNYYNSMSNSNSFQNGPAHSPSGYGSFNMQAGPSYHSNIINNTPVVPQLPTNIDIHNQSKKITQSLLGTEWSSDTTYNPKLYSNHEIETTGRKRKNESDRVTGKGAKSRRKKLNDIGGHSKTVASILMSDNTAGFKTAKHSPNDACILDSSERNALVSTLMDNLRTTVLFESFCLSFPRTDAKENAFRYKVLGTANTIDTIMTKWITSKPFPANFLMGASKCLSNFNTALKNSGNKGVNDDEFNNIDGRNRSIDQVEEHLPHSMIWVIKTGDKSLTASWEGQFVAAVNPIQSILSISVFQFLPSFSGEGIKCLQHSKLSKDLANDIVENMEQFEVSRQLRCDINLQKVVQIYLYKPNGEQNEGCLILEVTENPHYFQRWLHTSADDKNKWRERPSFILEPNGVTHPIVWIGGLVSELNELVALILESCQELKPVYEMGIGQPFQILQINGLAAATQNGAEKITKNNIVMNRLQRQKKTGRKLGSNAVKLRTEISEVLKSYSIIETTAEGFCSNSYDGREDSSGDISLCIILDGGLCGCFRDYINYVCDSAVELNSILQQKVYPRNYGYYENDFNLSLVPGGNIDNITTGELISSRCSEVVYFSFCAKEIGQLGYERHCSACRKCRTMRYWHCYACDRCTESRLVCEFCGHLRDDQSRCMIKPLSVFKSQVVAGTLSMEDIKKKWLSALDLPDDDIINLYPPAIDMNYTDMVEYNSDNAMVDQLGLLNPVGFLLGQPLAGASRKHRRYKTGQSCDLMPLKSGAHSAASACTMQ